MRQETINILILLSPVAIGIIFAVFNTEGMNNVSEKVESWFRKYQKSNSLKKNLFSKYLLHPILTVIVKFSDWTDNFSHRGVKNGTRVCITLYLIFFWYILLMTILQFVILLIIGAIVLYIIFKVLLNSNVDFRRSYQAGRRIVGPAGSGQRVNPKTGIIQEEGLLGWKDTDKRINPDTGIIQEEGLIDWKDTSTRINQKTGIIQEEGFIGHNDTDTRINPETGIIQKRGLLDWVDTDERINPETGKHQKNGLLGWVDD